MSINHEPDPNSLVVFNYEEEYGPEHNMRPGTWIKPAPMLYFLNAGGIGDYINYTAALIWVAKNCPWVHGTIYANPYFLEFLNYHIRQFENWRVMDGASVTLPHNMAFSGPELMVNGQNITHQLCNATGSHLMDLGFQYYANIQAAPPGTTLPFMDIPLKKVRWELREKAGKYVVFTPGAVTAVRMTHGRHLNPLIEYVCSKGLLPVFLGKSEIVKDLNPKFADDIDYHKGLDLRDQTTLLQAAAIMQHAACVLGLDNGLLHLAACTPAKVIFGYNITEVKDREPRRTWGKLINVALTKEELACVGCQTHWKLIINHTFHKCMYGDNKCIDMLFSGGRFERAIDEMLSQV